MKTKRKVRINHVRNTFFVEYVERAKGQHHNAAQFNDESFSRTNVEDWIEQQGDLELVEENPGASVLKTTIDYVRASLSPASEYYVPIGTYADEKPVVEDECTHDEHGHGCCLNCGHDITEDLVCEAEYRSDCLQDR